MAAKVGVLQGCIAGGFVRKRVDSYTIKPDLLVSRKPGHLEFYQPIIVLFPVFRHSVAKCLYPTGYKVTVNIMVTIGMTASSLVLFLMLELLFHRMGLSEPCLHVSVFIVTLQVVITM